MTGEFRPGEHLREETLVSGLKVSRSVVRQVLIRLVAEGLLKDEPKRGKSVAEFNEETLAKLVPIRIALEQVAVREAIAKMTKEDEAELRRLAARLREPNLDLAEQDALDVSLHRKIGKIADNDELANLLARVVGPFHFMSNAVLFSPYYRRNALGVSAQQLFYERERNPAGHQPLVEALCRRDVAAATRAVEEHIIANWSSSPEDFGKKVGELIQRYFHESS